MKWMIRKRPESDVIPEQDKEEKAQYWPFKQLRVNWPFVKGTSVDERKWIRIYMIE